MKHLISLVKLGNLKIGKVIKGNVTSLEKILVTTATKDNQENFSIFPGFNKEGESEVKVTLPFESPELNFEVNYVSFLKIDDIEYIAKAEKIGDPIVLHPLNPEDFNEGSKTIGELTVELIEKLSFDYTGFLKVMLPGVSSFGEVFYFKTKSINSIRAIKDQLVLSKALVGGLTNYPFIIKPIRKDVSDGKTITYLSIGLDMDALYEYKKERESVESDLKFDAIDRLYLESRKLEVEALEELSIDSVVVIANKYEETVSIKDTETEFNERLDEVELNDPELRDLVLEHSTAATLTTILKYYVFLKSSNRKAKSVFMKSLVEGKKPFKMLLEINEKEV